MAYFQCLLRESAVYESCIAVAGNDGVTLESVKLPTGMCTLVPGHMAEERGPEFPGEATMKNTHGHSRVSRRSFLAGAAAAS